MQAVAPSLGVEVEPVNMRDAGEIGSAIAAFARTANGGLVVTRVAARCSIANSIITLSARYKAAAAYSILSSPRAA
jgi:putative ABC transport system substrate-binding protein